jgi:RHS repeat-associated protein
VQHATADSDFPLLAAFGTVTWGECGGAKTRVRGINLAAGAGAWAIGFQAWEGTWEKSAATTNSWWAASSFGFTGREHELDSGLVYARARYLNPAVGRWDRPDPLVLGIPPSGRTMVAEAVLGAETELHLYSYVNALPTRATDPSGLIPAGALVLAMMPIGLQWDSVVIGVTEYLIARAEDAALISPTNAADCDECMIAVANARRIIWTGWGKPRDALLRVRMREYLLFFAIGQMVGADDVLKLTGHRQAIEQEQAQLKAVAAIIMAACKNPQLNDLGGWYLYIATLRMPQ